MAGAYLPLTEWVYGSPQLTSQENSEVFAKAIMPAESDGRATLQEAWRRIDEGQADPQMADLAFGEHALREAGIILTDPRLREPGAGGALNAQGLDMVEKLTEATRCWGDNGLFRSTSITNEPKAVAAARTLVDGLLLSMSGTQDVVRVETCGSSSHRPEPLPRGLRQAAEDRSSTVTQQDAEKLQRAAVEAAQRFLSTVEAVLLRSQ